MIATNKFILNFHDTFSLYEFMNFSFMNFINFIKFINFVNLFKKFKMAQIFFQTDKELPEKNS